MTERSGTPRSRPRATTDRARRLAFDALRKVNSEDAYANLVLADLLAERRLTTQDAGFATELLAGTCRAQGQYDQIIAAAGSRPLGSLQPAVIDLLRLGTHQLLAMRVPAHAAVGATVDLAAETVGRRVTGLVNAILRRVGALDLDGWIASLSGGLDDLDALALRTAHPRWIVEAYADVLPRDELEAALRANNVAPRVSLAVRPGLADVHELVEAGAEPGRWSPFAASWAGNPAALAAVRDGRAGVQDEGSQLAALGLARASGTPAGPWLDLCAGPGGKAALLTGLALESGSRVVATELAPHRAALVVGGVRGYGPQDRPLVVVADGTRPAWRPGSFARVLADVPCSGLGALRRRPEARWRRQPAEVDQLHRLQLDLLETAVASVAPGGVVAYVTCSPHRHETVDVVDRIRARHPGLAPVDPTDLLPGVPDANHGDYLQLWPHRHGTDAMFAAYLRAPGGRIAGVSVG